MNSQWLLFPDAHKEKRKRYKCYEPGNYVKRATGVAGGVRCISNAALYVSREGGVLLTNLVKFITVGENELDIG